MVKELRGIKNSNFPTSTRGAEHWAQGSPSQTGGMYSDAEIYSQLCKIWLQESKFFVKCTTGQQYKFEATGNYQKRLYGFDVQVFSDV